MRVKRFKIHLGNNVRLVIGYNKLENILIIFLFSMVMKSSDNIEKSLEIMLYLKKFLLDFVSSKTKRYKFLWDSFPPTSSLQIHLKIVSIFKRLNMVYQIPEPVRSHEEGQPGGKRDGFEPIQLSACFQVFPSGSNVTYLVLLCSHSQNVLSR